jgi:ParB family chromosome partitioning protein
MNRISLPINEIIVNNRQRQDYGDIEELATSLTRFGLIQPIVVNQDKTLIAGGRRLEAARRCAWKDIDVVYRHTMSQDELHELELEENVRRKEMDWKEKTLNILTIHRLKKKRSALEGSRWGYRETAEMLSVKGHSNILYAVTVGELLEAKDAEITACTSMSDAWRVVMRREEDAMNAEIAKKTADFSVGVPVSITNDFADGFTIAPVPLESTVAPNELDEARYQYLSNPLNDPEEFDSYYASRLELRSKKEQHASTIYLSKMLYNCDSVDFMLHADCKERFDHIITDIPYGIDMEMLNQQSAMVDIGTVREEHDVEGNEDLMRRFFPAAFHCLKQSSYLITWCDQWQWKFMADLALAAGFRVQRWPITWVKTHRCKNECANINFTKSTEIALVCRKGVATLSETDIPCHIVASHDDYKERLGHPFVKPFAIWKYLIEAVSLQGQTIFEPFAGRGSGLLSILRCQRQVIGCELNEDHFNALVSNVRTYYQELSSDLTFA